MNKKLLLGIFLVSIIALTIFTTKLVFHGTHMSKPGNQTVKSTPTPSNMQEKAIITNIGANTQKISFPTYKISFNLPSNLKQDTSYSGEVSPFGNTLAHINLISSDYRVNQLPIAIKGIMLNMGILTKDNDFIGSVSQNYMDIPRSIVTANTTLLPTNNPLVTSKNTKIYSLIQDHTVSAYLFSGYFVNMLLDKKVVKTTKDNASLIQIRCNEAGIAITSTRCQDIVKNILATLEIQ